MCVGRVIQIWSRVRHKASQPDPHPTIWEVTLAILTAILAILLQTPNKESNIRSVRKVFSISSFSIRIRGAPSLRAEPDIVTIRIRTRKLTWCLQIAWTPIDSSQKTRKLSRRNIRYVKRSLMTVKVLPKQSRGEARMRKNTNHRKERDQRDKMTAKAKVNTKIDLFWWVRAKERHMFRNRAMKNAPKTETHHPSHHTRLKLGKVLINEAIIVVEEKEGMVKMIKKS